MALQIKKGDLVKVIAGKDKGKTANVLSVNPENHTLVVDGVNVVTKHVKPRSAQQAGGIVKEPGNIDASNVMLVCPKCGKATRIAVKTVGGKKVRVCKFCGEVLEYKAEEKPAKKSVRKKSAKAAEEQPVEETPAATAETAPVKKTVRKKSAKTEAPAEANNPEVESLTDKHVKKTVRKKSAKADADEQ